MKLNSTSVAEWAETRLPADVTTKSGVVFDPRENLWDFRDGLEKIHLNFSALPVTDELLSGLKATLIWYAENRGANYLNSVFKEFKAFLDGLKDQSVEMVGEITGVAVLRQRAELGPRLKQVASVLRKWAELRYPGVGPDVVSVLNKIRIKRPPMGVDVLTLNPIRGPFSPVEQAGIQGALNDAYAEGSLSEEVFLLTWLFIALGARPIQLAAMKVCDLSRAVSSNNTESFILNVPRAKQRNVTLRDELKPRHLVSQIGRPLFVYAQRVRARFEGRLEDASQAPLFPANEKYEDVFDVKGWARFHRTPVGLGSTLQQALAKLQVLSERTGKPLSITPIRFRRTFGTNAAQEGHGLLVIAELLDHSGTESAGVYVAATPELAGRIDKATALHMAPLAQAFKGHLINDESEATRCTDPSSRIIDLRIDQSAAPMGSCGQLSYCGFIAPIACYTCKSFEPWLDGPHEAVLDQLLMERDRAKAPRIAAVNDRTILAVAQVVEMCRIAQESVDE